MFPTSVPSTHVTCRAEPCRRGRWCPGRPRPFWVGCGHFPCKCHVNGPSPGRWFGFASRFSSNNYLHSTFTCISDLSSCYGRPFVLWTFCPSTHRKSNQRSLLDSIGWSAQRRSGYRPLEYQTRLPFQSFQHPSRLNSVLSPVLRHLH